MKRETQGQASSYWTSRSPTAPRVTSRKHWASCKSLVSYLFLMFVFLKRKLKAFELIAMVFPSCVKSPITLLNGPSPSQTQPLPLRELQDIHFVSLIFSKPVSIFISILQLGKLYWRKMNGLPKVMW